MLRGRRRLALLGAVLAGAVAGGVVLASGGGPPRTEAVTGTFSASPVNAMTRTCTGQDGDYLEIRGKFAGPIVSPSDSRLTGQLKFVAHALVNSTTGLGTFEGSFRIRQANGRQSAHGVFHTVVTEGSLNHGFARGKVAGAEDFFARFESTVDAGLNVTGQFGDMGDDRTPAVIQSGHCTGPWTRVP